MALMNSSVKAFKSIVSRMVTIPNSENNYPLDSEPAIDRFCMSDDISKSIPLFVASPKSPPNYDIKKIPSAW